MKIGAPDRAAEVCWQLTRGSARSGPLTELWLADVVDVDPDAADIALVDLDLVQICGGMSAAPGRAPVVLPEVGAQAVLQRPFDRFGVAVHTGALVADDRLPAAQIGRDLLLVLLVGRIVIDRGVDGGAGRAPGGGVQLPPAPGMLDARALAAQPVGGALLAVLIAGDDLQAVLVEVAGFGEFDRLAQHPRATGPAIRYIADRARGAGRPDLAGGDHSGRVVQQDAQAIGRRRRGAQRFRRDTETDQGRCRRREFQHVAPRHVRHASQDTTNAPTTSSTPLVTFVSASMGLRQHVRQVPVPEQLETGDD